MTVDVIGELERYGRHAESTAPAIGLETVLDADREPVPAKALRPAPRFRVGLAIAVAAAVMTLVAIGAIALLDPFSSEQPVVDTVPPTTAPVTIPEDRGPVPTIEAAPVESIVWSRMDAPAFDIAGRIEALASTVIGWVAVGAAEGPTPAIWVSDDGAGWSARDSDAFTGVRGDARAVAEHTNRLVVVGMDQAAGVPAFWYSNAGFEWIRVTDPAVNVEGAEVHDVLVHFFAAYVAIGTDVWTSGNGIEWQRTDLEGTAYALLEFDDGLLAGGVDVAGDDAAMWVSTDIGNTWSPIAVESRSDRYDTSAIHAVTQTEDGFLAVGSVGQGETRHPAVWHSTDGGQWELAWVDEGFDGSFESVDYASGQTVAVGKTDGGGTVWLSSDSGDSWVQYEDRLGLFEGNAVNPGGLNVVRAGEEGTFMSGGERTGHPAIWLGVPPEPIPEVDAEGRPLVGWTCQARIDNGAVWQFGEWDEEAGHYVASGVTPCLDLLDVHLEPQQWKVEWEGTARVTEVGFLLWFERGIHGTIYAEREISGETGEWMTPIIEPDPEAPFAWIAMPHSFDDWEEISWTITPCGVSCG